MGHRTLEPDNDDYHALPVVLELLRKEFAYVEVDGTNSVGSIYVEIRDDETSKMAYLATTIDEAEPIFFGFTSSQHEDAATTLVRRCAEVLDYEIIDDPNE